MAKVMLSTIDNPFNPFENYAAWSAYDVSSGYHTAEFLARIAQTSDQLSDSDYELAIEQAVDECVSENVLGIFIKVVKEE